MQFPYVFHVIFAALAVVSTTVAAHKNARTTHALLSDIMSDTNVNSTPGPGSLKSDFPWYHTAEELRSEVQRLATGCGGAITTRTVSNSGVDIEVARVRGAGTNPINKAFLLFGEHSRELISPETGLFFMKMLCGEALDADDPLHSVAKSLLQDNEYEIVLNGNPRSRTVVESGEFCLRANPSGVDLNRNWDAHWSSSQGDEGGHAFSEPETQIFRQLVTEYKPTTFLTVHSGVSGMYMPYAYSKNAGIGSRNQQSMLQILKTLDEKHCKCPYGAVGSEVGYPCPGTCLDWVYDNMDTPYTFGFEIWSRPDLQADYKARWEQKVQAGALLQLHNASHLASPEIKDLFEAHPSDFVQVRDRSEVMTEEHDARSCFPQFNPPTEEKYTKVLRNWGVAILEMSQQVVDNLKRDKHAGLKTHNRV